MILNVTPSSENRRAFARWAVSQRVRTNSSNTFAVPDELFPAVPEEVLIGARVNGQPYVPANEVSRPKQSRPGKSTTAVIDRPTVVPF